MANSKTRLNPKPKVLLAVGIIEIENILKQDLGSDHSIVGVSTDKEGIVPMIEKRKPDILVIRETLQGQTNIFTLINTIRYNFPNIRIVFIGVERSSASNVISTLISYGIYDILSANVINIKDVIKVIRNPLTFKDVAKFLNPLEIKDEMGNVIDTKFVVSTEEDEDEEEEKNDKKEDEQEENNKEKSNKQENKKRNGTKENNNKDKQMESKNQKDIEENNEKNNSKKQNNPKTPTIKPKEEREKEEMKVIVKEKRIVEEKIVEKQIISLPKTILFMPSNHGVGSSTLALNTATYLAQKNKKTIILDLDYMYSSFKFLFNVYSKTGINTAIESLDEKRYENVQNAIHQLKTLVDEDFKKKIPDNLHLMTYSSNLTKAPDLELLTSTIQELIITLMHKFKFQYVIIHCPNNVTQDTKKELYYIAENINIVSTQNITDLIFAKKQYNEIVEINQEEKTEFIINKFCKSSVSKDVINEMFEKQIITFDNFYKEIVEANFKGVPLVSDNKKILNHSFFKKISGI